MATVFEGKAIPQFAGIQPAMSINISYQQLNQQRRRFKYLCKVCTVLTVNLLILHVYWNGTVHMQLRAKPKANDDVPPPLVLGWNNFFNNPLMQSLTRGNKFSDRLVSQDVAQCTHKCEYSDNKTRIADASVVVFHMIDPLEPLPPLRLPTQLYTFFVLESPPHTGGHMDKLPGAFFNLTMTYRADSDIHFPYDAFDQLDDQSAAAEATQKDVWTEKEIDEKIAKKSALALQIVSNCGMAPSGRSVLTDELKKHAQVDVFGKCNGRSCDDRCFAEQMETHFFYLAFENSVCLNYVTEKFWNLKRLIVPVVLARSVFAHIPNLPNDSFIAADDFDSAEQLAQHLKMLSEKKDLYKKHFEWTRHYKRTHIGNGPNGALCRLCELAHQTERSQKTIADISHFWRDEAHCRSGFVQEALWKKKN